MKLYLDEMISPRVAAGLRRRGHDVVAAVDRGALGRSDAHQLAVAIEERRALATFDVRDFSVLAKAAAVAGTDHYGIVFVPPGRFRPSDIGRLVNALADLLERHRGDEAMRNRAIFLADV